MKPVPPPGKAAVIDYRGGGLVDAVSRSRIFSDEPEPAPEALLAADPYTQLEALELTHTFRKERRAILQSLPPEERPYFAVLYRRNRCWERNDDVAACLRSRFGLSQAEAREIIAAVGTAP